MSRWQQPDGGWYSYLSTIPTFLGLIMGLAERNLAVVVISAGATSLLLIRGNIDRKAAREAREPRRRDRDDPDPSVTVSFHADKATHLHDSYRLQLAGQDGFPEVPRLTVAAPGMTDSITFRRARELDGSDPALSLPRLRGDFSRKSLDAMTGRWTVPLVLAPGPTAILPGQQILIVDDERVDTGDDRHLCATAEVIENRGVSAARFTSDDVHFVPTDLWYSLLP
jgi:hypothetical protein